MITESSPRCHAQLTWSHFGGVGSYVCDDDDDSFRSLCCLRADQRPGSVACGGEEAHDCVTKLCAAKHWLQRRKHLKSFDVVKSAALKFVAFSKSLVSDENATHWQGWAGLNVERKGTGSQVFGSWNKEARGRH